MSIDETEMREVAAQLRKPEGAAGIETGLQMNLANKEMNMFAIRALDAQPNESILEIGMGNGEFVKEITSVHPTTHYTGFDYSATMIDEATKKNDHLIHNGQVRFVFGNANALPFPDSSFDKAMGVNTIYFWEPQKELNELHRVLRQNGKLILGIRAKNLMRDYPFAKFGFTLYSPEELGETLSSNGFKVISLTENSEPPLELDGNIFIRSSVVVVAEPIK